MTHVFAGGPKTVLVKRTFFVWSDPCWTTVLTSLITFMGWGGVLTFCPERTSNAGKSQCFGEPFCELLYGQALHVDDSWSRHCGEGGDRRRVATRLGARFRCSSHSLLPWQIENSWSGHCFHTGSRRWMASRLSSEIRSYLSCLWRVNVSAAWQRERRPKKKTDESAEEFSEDSSEKEAFWGNKGTAN